MNPSAQRVKCHDSGGQNPLTEWNRLHTSMKNTITIPSICIGLLAGLALFASRQVAISRGDAFMQKNLHDEWFGCRCSLAFCAEQRTILWHVKYETDGLTSAPATVYVSLWGDVEGSNLSFGNPSTK